MISSDRSAGFRVRSGFTWPEFVAVVVFIAFLLACLGVGPPGHALLLLAVGWVPYLIRVLPEVTLDPAGVATGAVSLLMVTVGVHQLGRWWIRNAGRPNEAAPNPEAGASREEVAAWAERGEGHLANRGVWPVRRTLAVVGLTLLLFVAGLSGTAVVHQAVWLATSPDPFLNQGRTAARRTQSKNNLKQIGLALHNYHDVYDAFPAGGTFDAAGRGRHSWHTMILPFIEQGPLFGKVDLSKPWNDPANAEAIATRVPVFENPGVVPARRPEATGAPGVSHYSANSHLLGANRSRNLKAITDGMSNTLLAGEAAGNYKAWGDPTNVRDPALGINATPDGFGGPWEGGAQFLMGDGSVRFLSETIDQAVLKALATPDGGDKVPDEF